MNGGATKDWAHSELADALQSAISSHALHLYFQPIVSLADRSATKLEALPRWSHPERGMLAPSDFIEVAEGAGLLEQLERWAITEALHQLSRWSSGVPGQLSISVNLSSQHAFGDELTDVIRAEAVAARASTRRLGVEISEQALTAAAPASLRALRNLSDLGVSITVDNFAGTLEAEDLKRLPISAMKIGRNLVAGIPDDEESLRLTSSAVALGRDLGLAVIATGIESPGQAAALRELGCRYGQGFLFSVPMPAEVLEERMRSR